MADRRHSRRAYDKDGTMLPPATVASTKAHGMTSITATCHAKGCHRSADVSLDGFPGDMAIPDIAPLLKCSACGGKRITVMTNMREWYALCRARKLGVP
jgi:hypothetical protein